MGEKEIAEEIHNRGLLLAQQGGAMRPMFEAAKAIVEEREAARETALSELAEGTIMELDPELFPPTVFNEDGTRKHYKDSHLPINTYEEDRMYYEFRDSRM